VGAAGPALWRDGAWAEHPGFEVEVRDLVGAGDAFLAVVVTGLLRGLDTRAILQHAALLGAYVATQPAPCRPTSRLRPSCRPRLPRAAHPGGAPPTDAGRGGRPHAIPVG
jgi:fructokinase